MNALTFLCKTDKKAFNQLRRACQKRLRAKWHEARRHLRAANKGAERNANIAELANLRLLKYIKSVKDEGTTARCWKWVAMSDSEMRLKMGELSAQEIRNIRACLRAILGKPEETNQ